MVPCGQHVTDEFFRGGFAVASCHGEHWTRPAPAISPGQGLQGAKGILHDRDVGSAFPLPIRGDGVGRPLVQGMLHKSVPVEVGAFQGHKHHSFELSPGVGGHAVRSISGCKQSQQGRVREVDHGVLRQRKTPQPSCGVRCIQVVDVSLGTSSLSAEGNRGSHAVHGTSEADGSRALTFVEVATCARNEVVSAVIPTSAFVDAAAVADQ